MVNTDMVKEWHVRNGIICKNCKHRRDIVHDFFTERHFTYCVKQRFGEVSIGVTTGDGFCEEWEAKDDDKTSV